MAQYIKPLDTQDGESRYEVIMLATGKDGAVVEATNPLPVTLGAESIEISGPVTIPGTVEISNDVGNPIPVTSASGSFPIMFEESNLDAFGRLRVSNTRTLFDSSFRYEDNGYFDTATTGTASAAFSGTYHTVNMTVGNNSGDRVIRETKRTFPYQPGKSLLIFCSFTMNQKKVGLRQRVGFFGGSNGIFLEVEDNTVYIVKRNNGSDTRVAQSSWSEDTLSTLDVSKSHIFFIDIEWLGVGTVRTGFVIDGRFVVVHKFHHANLIVGTYMQTAVLPIRYEIENTGATGSSSTLMQICASVMSEGGYEGNSMFHFAKNAPSAGVDLGAAGTLVPLISLRLKSSQLDAIILPSEIDILSLSNQGIEFSLLLNASLTGASFADHSLSQCQIDTTATAVSGGRILQQGFVTNNGKISLYGLENFNFQLGRFLNGTSDVITLAARGFNNNVKTVASLGWYQLT